MAKCSICLKDVDASEAAILTISGYGKPRYLCPHCEKLINTVCESNDKDEVSVAIESIGSTLSALNIDDDAVFGTISELFSQAKQRLENPDATTSEEAEAIDEDIPGEQEEEAPESDNADKNSDDVPEFDIPDELRESAEDRERDEKEAKRSKVFDTVVGWASVAILVGLVAFFVIKFIL